MTSSNLQSTHIYASENYDTGVFLTVHTRETTHWITTSVRSKWVGEGFKTDIHNEVNTMFFPNEEILKKYLLHMIETASKALAEMGVPA